jgi:uncharacterized protein (DUF1499 family)
VISAIILGGAMFGCSGKRPADLGLKGGVLRPCPDTPNCVSSEGGTPADKLVAPLPAPGGRADLVRLAAVVAAWPRTEVITTTPEYLHAESTSLLLRFVDDVEFRFDSAAQVIHVRSASRLGKSDLGVNRKRVEGIRDRWAATVGATK